MKNLLLTLLLLLPLHADDDVVKVVFDLTTGDLKTFERKVLKGIAAHKADYGGRLLELTVAVVIHGNAYKFFLNDPVPSHFGSDGTLREALPMLRMRIASLAEHYDVSFLMCRAGMAANGLNAQAIHPAVSLVPNATIALIDKQHEGFAYIPIGD